MVSLPHPTHSEGEFAPDAPSGTSFPVVRSAHASPNPFRGRVCPRCTVGDRFAVSQHCPFAIRQLAWQSTPE